MSLSRLKVHNLTISTLQAEQQLRRARRPVHHSRSPIRALPPLLPRVRPRLTPTDVTIKLEDGKDIALHTSSKATVAWLKQLISEEKHIPKNEIVLKQEKGGKPLQDSAAKRDTSLT
ncbi:hypothetical protein DFP72DRAFT_1072486 [Ephemerocybe angulata]|uniref:Ubiquitin-like domain-containing protein n=1 Tax=Ephemerocybe angulata TaxID=980116 RepID=A0A8H6HPU3_9AGAR|nr:hypothetical protein DFP72DRAFT_1072486 [Tulosesus angulatus]